MRPSKIVLHCSDTPNGEYVRPEVIWQEHIRKGWRAIGYHLVINVDGELHRGRGFNEEGAHCKGENNRSLGVCLIGRDLFTRAQFETLRRQIDGIMLTYDMAERDIYCHYEFESAKKQGKTCPNIRAADLVAWYIQDDWDHIKEYLFKEER